MDLNKYADVQASLENFKRVQKSVIWTKVLGHLSITPTGTVMTARSKYIDINVELVPTLQL